MFDGGGGGGRWHVGHGEPQTYIIPTFVAGALGLDFSSSEIRLYSESMLRGVGITAYSCNGGPRLTGCRGPRVVFHAAGRRIRSLSASSSVTYKWEEKDPDKRSVSCIQCTVMYNPQHPK
jgi:hypothetical protein